MVAPVQSSIGDYSTLSEATMAAPITQGNLLVAIVSERSGGSDTDHALSTAGWTKRSGQTIEPTDASFRRSASIFTKVAGASEPLTVGGSAGGAACITSVWEYELDAGQNQWTFLEVINASNGAVGGADSLASGNTSSLIDRGKFLLAAGVVKNAGYSFDPVFSFTNGFNLDTSLGWTPSGMGHAMGYVGYDLAGGVKNTTMSYNVDAVPNNGLAMFLLAFRVSDEQAPTNQAPVANDDTFSVSESVSNGAVVGTYTATDSDGTVDSYSITGTTLAINNIGQITIADNSGLTAGVPVVETVTATDNEGASSNAQITVNVTAPALSIVSTDFQLQRNTSFSLVCRDPSTVPDLTTTLSNGTNTLTATSVVGTNPYTITFDVGDIAKQVGDYVWTLDINGQTVNTASLPLVVQAGWSVVNQVNPVTTEGSAWSQSTGDTPVTGDHLEHEVATSPSGIPVSITETGGINLGATPTQDQTFQFRAVQTDGTISNTQVFTWQHAVQADNPATGDIVVNGAAQEGQTLSIDTSGIADADGIQGFAYSFTINSLEVSDTSSYTIQPGDVGQVIDIEVTMTDNNDEPYRFTAQTGVVTALPTGDTQAPTLSLNGAASISHIQGQPFTDQGANWTDNVDGSGTVYADIALDINAIGPQTLRYNRTDAAGNSATEVTRLVTVITAPIPGIKADSILTSEGWLVGEFPGQIDRPEATLGSEGWEV